jgi:hypothetical protein
MLSTTHSTKTVNTNKKDRQTGEYILKSHCIAEYNKFMKGVGTTDEYLSYYSILRKTVTDQMCHLMHFVFI